MNNPFEQIEKMIQELGIKVESLESKIKGEKRWLNIREVAHYIGYSTDSIHKLKGEEFFEGIHYHKRSGKLLFDKEIIDKWVLGIDEKGINPTINIKETINNILDGLDS